MTDEIWKRDEVESPCVKVCVIQRETGYCIGCQRTADEIGRWSRITPEERRQIMSQLAHRANASTRRAGGRAGRRARQRLSES